MAPTKSISKSSFPGRKSSKKRLTVVLTSNRDGSFKLPLLFVGTARQPRCFKGKSAEELGLDYANIAKGWMNTQLFRHWIESFNETMKSENRHVLLLLDNASSHRVDEPLSNVQVHMLPPNTTAHLQPQDAGIIRSFKAHVNELKNRYYVDKLDDLFDSSQDEKESFDSSASALFHVDILVAMQWAKQAWEEVTSSTIKNCWRHTGILDDDLYELVRSMERVRLAPHSITPLCNSGQK